MPRAQQEISEEEREEKMTENNSDIEVIENENITETDNLSKNEYYVLLFVLPYQVHKRFKS